MDLPLNHDSDGVDDELHPLIAARPVQSPTQLSLMQRYKAYLIIPAVLLASVASVIPESTTIEVIRQTSCRFWYQQHSPPSILQHHGAIPDELCAVPEVERLFAQLVTASSIIDGIAST